MMNSPQIRFPLDPGDIPPSKAARRMGLTEVKFREVLPELLARGFPHPDPTTENFDLDAIDEWRKQRHPRLFHNPSTTARNARAVVSQRLEALKNDEA